MMTSRDEQEDAPRSSALRAGGIREGGLRALDGSILLTQVEGLLTAPAPRLTPRDALTAVCWAVEGPLALAGAVYWKRVGGRSSSLAWSARGVPAGRRMAARESAWTMAHALLTGGAPPVLDARSAGVSLVDDALALSAVLYVESRRLLDEIDRQLLRSLLRRMACAPSGHEG